jgi:hypothetical protein
VIGSIIALAGLLGMVAVCGVDALKDRTPRRPFVWSRPGLSWWAAKRTPRERARTTVTLPTEQSS